MGAPCRSIKCLRDFGLIGLFQEIDADSFQKHGQRDDGDRGNDNGRHKGQPESQTKLLSDKEKISKEETVDISISI